MFNWTNREGKIRSSNPFNDPMLVNKAEAEAIVIWNLVVLVHGDVEWCETMSMNNFDDLKV